MKKVLIATEKPFASVAVEGMRAVIENAGLELILLEKYPSKEDFLSAVSNVDALIVRSDKVDRDVFNVAEKLKIVVRAGAGYDNVDLVAATNKGVIVENTPGQNSNAVAELVFGMVIMAARSMYSGATGFELKGKRLGLQAFGQVGRNVARIAAGFGMQISAFDPYCPDDVMINSGINPLHSLTELYQTSDILSIHIPATPETVRSIGFDLISSMPKNAILVNTARKEVVDEEGLEKVLKDRPDLYYVADVRPDNASALLEKFPSQVFFTPKKMGAQTSEANINAGIAAANQVVDFLCNDTVKFKVNK